MSSKLKIICLLLIFMMLFSHTVVSADQGDGAMQADTQIATEYYSDNLYDPPEDTAMTVTADGAPAIKAISSLLMEKDSGKILQETGAHEQLPPASITKIMTLLLVMEAIEEGKLRLEDEVTVSEHAQSMGGSQIWLEVGEVMSVNDLLKAAAVASANDACVALAEQVTGSEEAFVEQMNQKAAGLGMNDTHFVNCTGLDAQGHLTSAHDVALMSRELLDHQLVKDYSSIWMDTLRDGETALVNTNKLVRFYDGCTGLKTGTTDGAGHCLSASAQREGMELIAVVMGSDSSDDRFSGARNLLDYGFANWLSVPIDVSEGLDQVAVKSGEEYSVKVEAHPLDSVVVPKGRESEIEKTVQLPESVSAPVEEYQVVGTVQFSIDGELLAETQIYAAEEIPKMSVGSAFKKLLSGVFTL